MFRSFVGMPRVCGVFLVFFLIAQNTLADNLGFDASPMGFGNSNSGAFNARALNPDIAVDGLFALSQFNRDNPLVFNGGHDPKINGFNVQQLELTFGAAIDPFFRADANLIFTAEGVEIEEAYATTTSLPWNLQFKGGQFFTAFGRFNPTHPHAWNFANMPLVLGNYFGGDGLRNPGAQLSWLTPLPWYSEIIVSGQNSTGVTVPSFRPEEDISTDPPSPAPNATMRSPIDWLTMVRSNNFVSISDEWALNLGGSYLNGANATGLSARTRIYGGDLYLRYRRPDTLSYVALTVEALGRSYDTDTVGDSVSDWGWYTELDYRLGAPWQRWHAGLRYDRIGPNRAPAIATTNSLADTSARYRISPVVTFYPTEFSKVRFQYDYDKPDDFEDAQQVGTVQLEFAMGAHGAHKF